MRTLVIDTATAACSVALVEDGRVIAARHEVVGRGHAERLVPMIAELPNGGRADRLLVDIGPGSFTGVRVGIAAARGLALGWAVPVRGFSSLALVAAAALARTPRDAIAAVLEAGHGELFMQIFDAALTPLCDPVSLPPAMAAARIGATALVGSGSDRLAGLLPPGEDALPDARDIALLPPALIDLDPRPLYGRAPDAKLPAAKAARA
ncbi:tRNA (adenosine(37)-N6)-threonylcarbamoyltransferase complex dimerization subunit type 1 TsaB [Sphingomonas sp. KR1UV-12]|uniref:tRNA (Adenosine(37)-N6)-threonylcarbamoyltransferase complex dimerization subunit type 1 TsaB n=1 Tax=Sphingomonas aurea TaxID=3063994 RepID=A0ABT9EN33_9SPHN|nr:tRNA (adenosine(37)-N6)-threonylcarbamoyltransferase complex dimerization subunit type 1 TsaB [Sphingomonas sp. KR1UV-12]MDP1028237.1 tRNA (adenosine(37)-N6)-threonylcarbamoyltransferase complex dimerization subunit type 1 TsaB [Sphingomonas sp. KR1UV-12]